MPDPTDDLLGLYERLVLGRMDLVAALAWPVLVFWIVWMLRHQLRYLIANIREVHGPSGTRALIGDAGLTAQLAVAEAAEAESELAIDDAKPTTDADPKPTIDADPKPTIDADPKPTIDYAEKLPRPAATSTEVEEAWARRRAMALKNVRHHLTASGARNAAAHGKYGNAWARLLLQPLEHEIRMAAATLRGDRMVTSAGDHVETSSEQFSLEEEFARSDSGLFDSVHLLQEHGVISRSFLASFLSLREVATQQTEMVRADDYLNFERAVDDLRSVLRRNVKKKGA